MLAPRLRELSRKLLPRTRVLRADLRRIDRLYLPLIDHAEGDERESLIGEYMHERDVVNDELAS